jgi:hypothetical protein
MDEVNQLVPGDAVKAVSVPGLYGVITQTLEIPADPVTGKPRIEVKWDVSTMNQYWDIDDVSIM